jgi:hypothetical protein
MNQGELKNYQEKMVPELLAAQPRTISSGRIEKHAHQSINYSEKQTIHPQKNKTVL